MKNLVLALILLPIFGQAQINGDVFYKQKEVHTVTFQLAGRTFDSCYQNTVKTWKTDTTNYSSNYRITFTDTTVKIAGYSTYKFDHYELKRDTVSNEPVAVYHFTTGHWFTFIPTAKVAYLEYPVTNLTMKLIAFNIND